MDDRLADVGMAGIFRAGAVRARPAEAAAAPGWDQRPALIATAVAVLLAIGYLAMPPTGQDLSAQLARADFAGGHPLTPVDLRWFGGTLALGYSLWVPWLAGVIGVRLLGALAAVAGTWLATRLIQRANPPHPLLGGVTVAVCQVADVLQGRITYQVALVCALAAVHVVLSPRPGRYAAATALAVLAGAASPVATLQLCTAALVALALGRRSAAAALAIGSIVPTAVISLVFGEGGSLQFPTESALRAIAATLLVIVVVRHRAVRLGAIITLLIVVVSWIIPSPIGSNAERLGLLFAIPLVAAFAPWRRLGVVIAVVLVVVAQPPVPLEPFRLAGAPASRASYYTPLVAAIHAQGPLLGRVTVPEMNGHWAAAFLARQVPLARGWLRQVDLRLNDDVFFAHPPTAASYRAWLTRNAVQYVAVPDAQLNPFGRRERALVQGGLPYLTRVWSDAHWTLYAVDEPTPIVGRPGTLTRMTPATITFTTRAGAEVPLTMRWFRWLSVSPGACLTEQDGHVVAHTVRAGTFTVSSNIIGAKRHC